MFVIFHLFLTLITHYLAFCVIIETVDESWDYGLRDALFTACKVGDVVSLSRLLEPLVIMAESRERSESNPSDTPSPLTLLNKPIDSSGFTLLHVASAAAQKAAVGLLLDKGGDPACRYEKIVNATLVKVKYHCINLQQLQEIQ